MPTRCWLSSTSAGSRSFRFTHDHRFPAKPLTPGGTPPSGQRRRLGAVTALVLGLFVGLTLLPVPITGPVGRSIGHGLWQILGAGALGIPLLGIGLALAGFDRLGSLDMKRSAVLIVGLSVLIPYLIGVVTHVGRADLDLDVGQRGLAARVVGVLPGFFRDDRRQGRCRGGGAARLPGTLRPDPGDLRLASAAAAGTGGRTVWRTGGQGERQTVGGGRFSRVARRCVSPQRGSAELLRPSPVRPSADADRAAKARKEKKPRSARSPPAPRSSTRSRTCRPSTFSPRPRCRTWTPARPSSISSASR